jgi:hypothetical protein
LLTLETTSNDESAMSGHPFRSSRRGRRAGEG